ncbi:MAG TPA: ABC transporter ATP-binding protein [Candidatus Limnocylindrales bacterium]|jgi:energy-coupling factor transport system ATP-binding protein|nr:ABC transporter ATP-binding protein [Candidatus Limnocylindrales bacterium]
MTAAPSGTAAPAPTAEHPFVHPAHASSGPMVVVRDARYVYPRGGVTALDGVTLDIPAGQIVGVVGQNGSGKTTLTKLLNGLLKPTSGTVVVNGMNTADWTVQKMAAHVGYVFQNPNHQLFATTVEKELEFGPRNLGIPEEEIPERVADAVEFFGLQDVLGQHPYRISFPMRKLVGIASIYTMRPRVFILDEPTTGQDHRTTSVINRLIKRLGERGDTVICVAHDMPLLADVAQRLLVMWNARLIADGTPREVFANAEVMQRTHLTPPQITQLSLRIPSRAGRPVALAVSELVDEMRGTPRGTEA